MSGKTFKTQFSNVFKNKNGHLTSSHKCTPFRTSRLAFLALQILDIFWRLRFHITDHFSGTLILKTMLILGILFSFTEGGKQSNVLRPRTVTGEGGGGKSKLWEADWWRKVEANTRGPDERVLRPILLRQVRAAPLMLLPDWAKINLCMILPNRRTVPQESLSCVLTWWLM